jgi:hypothetical protein
MVGTLAIFPIAFFLNPLNNKKKFLYAWVIITFSIYCSGFLLLIARSPRRFYALMVILLLLAFHFLEDLINAMRDSISVRRRKLLTYYLFTIVVMAFALKPGVHLMKSIETTITYEQVNPYKEIADQINTVQFPSPYAIIRSSQKPYTDYYIAYFVNKQLLGRPLSMDVDGVTEELKAADAKSLVIFDNPEIVEKLRKDKRYIHAGALKLKNYERHLNPINTKVDEITNWDNEVNVYILR